MSTKPITDPIIFDTSTQFTQLPKSGVGRLRISDTTPSVKNLTRFITVNGGSVAVTDFTDGQDGQSIKILGDGMTSVVHGAKIQTNTGANKLLIDGRVYNFTRFAGVWYEGE